MAMTAETGVIAQIGESAGVVWRCLAENGPLSMTKLVKEVELPKDQVLLALGWLAREDKITIDEGRTKTVTLR